MDSSCRPRRIVPVSLVLSILLSVAYIGSIMKEETVASGIRALDESALEAWHQPGSLPSELLLAQINHPRVEEQQQPSNLSKAALRRSFPNRCQAASSGGTAEDFFVHCSVPHQKGVQALEAYLDKRLANYSGNPECMGEVLEFHCLEFASRRKGWCDWTLAPTVQSPLDKDFLVRPSRDFASGLDEPPSRADHKLIFFYPSYAFVSTLERSLVALQHPNHIFLINVDAQEYADPVLVSAAQELATKLNSAYHDNVFLVQLGRVVYETSSQVLAAWPFMRWCLDHVGGWTHFILTDAQTYPLLSNTKLRETLWDRRDKIFFKQFPYKISPVGADKGAELRRYKEILPYCEGYRNERHVYYQQASALGSWTDDNGQLRDGYKRVDWLEVQLQIGWQFGKAGGNMVIVPRDLAQYLIHSPEAKMWTQYFKYTHNACEHLIVSLVQYYFKDKVVQDYGSCFMLWGTGPENIILGETNIQNMRDGDMRCLFARKLRVPESLEILSKIDKELRVDVSPVPEANEDQ
ncbi:hypothetical protein KFL_000460280 [Klebsormidium nitens]|uniref:Protein xylosyltransferase n=1 Tax=Klebsormidium nitens TaxID=105231 RepID=A0A1Y1HUA3_KLENI|nr:hypothetical protein KFL_000460280 [Klebsormidium nitens]|eukprot:GAQ80117.1 hypothetical protein KFL_000460280 [Klebsormidium nitens]